jgi:hypothetical protein
MERHSLTAPVFQPQEMSLTPSRDNDNQATSFEEVLARAEQAALKEAFQPMAANNYPQNHGGTLQMFSESYMLIGYRSFASTRISAGH